MRPRGLRKWKRRHRFIKAQVRGLKANVILFIPIIPKFSILFQRLLLILLFLLLLLLLLLLLGVLQSSNEVVLLAGGDSNRVVAVGRNNVVGIGRDGELVDAE